MLIRRCLIDAGDPELVHYEEVRELYRRKFDEDPLYKVVPYKDMPETLQKLKHTALRWLYAPISLMLRRRKW